MTDFETHPVGTAARIAELTAAQKYRYIGKDGKPVLARELEDRIEQLEADADMMFARGMSHGQQVLKDTRRLVIVDSPELVELREALTRANAATAAAYEVAARAIMKKCHDDMDRKEEAAIVRALATPDQTAAMDKLIAEAEARVWERAADIARYAVEVTGHRMREAKEKKNKKEERDWQSMLFCAVDIRTAILAASKKGGA